MPTKDEQIDKMVDKFLNMELPRDFDPDGGISFDKNIMTWPIGTNLLTATQAKDMIRYLHTDKDGMIDGVEWSQFPEGKT